MKQKLIIVNNGLRDYRGHYFETSISMAEAARRAGLHPVLATHVECRTDVLPNWLECYPIFRTDHWMSGPPAETPELCGATADLYAPTSAAIGAVVKGEATVRQYVSESFGLAPRAPEPVQTAWAKGLARLNRVRCRLQWAGGKAVWLGDRTAYFLAPPVLYDLAGLLYRQCVPRVLRREYHPRIKNRTARILRRLTGRIDRLSPETFPTEIARSLRQPLEAKLIRKALADFDSRFLQELEYGLIFKRDLERLLALAKANCDDHVLLGTAHAREAPAVHLITKRLGEERSPQFHLEYRHPLFRSDPTPQEFHESQNVQMHRQFFSLLEKWGPSSRMHFYTDTEELSSDHDLLGNLRFGVLPIPFRTEFAAHRRPAADRRLRLVYLGEPRDEKGFPWLAGLIDRMLQKYVAPGRVRFILQANVCAPQYNPKSAAVLPLLREYSDDFVQLVGRDAALTPEEYYGLLAEADIVLLPYDRDRYRACSSGTLAEAIASGCPVIVPANSWMSAQLGEGTGEAFTDRESFYAAVERVVDNFDAYHSAAEAYRDHWLAKHTPDHLVQALVARREACEPTRKAA